MTSVADLLTAQLSAEFGLGVAEVSPSDDETLGGIFREKTVPLTEFIYNKPYLGLGLTGFHLSDEQYDFIHHFEQIFFPETHALMAQHWGDAYIPTRYVNELVAEWGKLWAVEKTQSVR